MPQQGEHRGRSLLGIAVVFLFIAALFLFIGLLYYQDQKARQIRDAEETLQAVADLKVGQIENWRAERLGDAQAIFDNPFIQRALAQYLQDPGQQRLDRELTSWMQVLLQHYGYETILVLDAKGERRLAAGDTSVVPGEQCREIAAKVREERRILFSDLIRDSGDAPHLDLAVPVLQEGAPDSRVVGVVVLRIDPHRFLFPLIQAWPTASPSAETLLVRREGDEVVYLNELRHRRDTALKLRFPLNREELPAAKAVQGQSGVVSGIDYQGVSVIAVARDVPGSNWYVVAKIDRRELLDPVVWRARVGAVMAVGTLLILGFALFSLERARRSELGRRIAEEELKRRTVERQYELLSRYANDAIILVDEEMRVAECNEVATKAYGYAYEELKGMPISRLRTTRALPGQRETVLKARELGSLIYVTEHQRQDGSVFPVEINLRALRVEGERYLLAVIRDITERHRAERALRESEQRLSEAQRMAQLGYWAWDVNTGKVEWSEEVFRIFHLDPETFVPRIDSILALSPWAGDHERDQELIRRATESHQKGSYEQRFLRPDQSVGYYASTFEGRYDEEGRLVTIIGTVMDITERKLAEEEINRLNAELEERVRRRTAELHAANSELEAFAYSVSHDLRAPLRGMDGFSRALLDDESAALSERGRGFLRRISAASQRMSQLIDDLLRLSRVTRVEMHLQPVDLGELARSIARELRDAEPERDVEFRIAPKLLATADLALMRVMLQNLLGNAWKFTSRHPRAVIEFGLRDEEGERVFFVRDDGAGFDPAYADRLFGAFQRMHQQAEFEGEGIGLATVQRIVRRHGGRVWAEGAVERGAAFFFTLPGEERP